ncbi:hypothetical protein [Kerstersia gyiorum]|uniref:hypothetical protein n=1 Tax=Kerstersia gyiorum TaxID=206506 RepID=UPI00187CCBD1|nr:hypothetical protein [Kerstersia gyiorum]
MGLICDFFEGVAVSEQPIHKRAYAAPNFISDVSHSSSVMRVTRYGGNDIVVTFEKESVVMNDNGEYQLDKVGIAAISMSEIQARSLHETLGKLLSVSGASDDDGSGRS